MSATAVADPKGPEPNASVSPKGNPFVNFLVRRPCLTATITMIICTVTVVGTVVVVVREGTDIFGETSTREISDIRTREWEAYSKALHTARGFGQGGSGCTVKTSGAKRFCDTEIYPQQSQPADLVLMMFIAKSGDQLFTAHNVAQMKTVEDKILTNRGYSDFCLRKDPMGVDILCDPPVSPLNLFYARNVNIKMLVDEIDGLDGTMDGNLHMLHGQNQSADLSRIQGALSSTLKNIQYSTCVQGDVDLSTISSDFSIMQCVFNSTVARMNPQPAQMSVNIARNMFPLTQALSNDRGSIMQDVTATLKIAAYMKLVPSYAVYVDYYFDRHFSITSPKSKYSRCMIRFGQPLAGYRNRDDKKADQDTKFSTWFRREFNQYLQDTKDAGSVEVLFYATALIRDEFLSIILTDLLKVFISLALVFVWIQLQTGSIIIAIVGSMEIMFSLPLAFFFYYTVFGFKYFDSLNAMTIFIVCAIGADDIFVFMDQYKQSAYHREVCVDLKTRMNWVYSRAAWAMFITSATTCAAFVCTAVSPLPSIQSFGIFSAIVIATDYILIITWFPACVVMYHNYLEKRPCCCFYGQCNQMFPCQWTMETTTTIAYNRELDVQTQKQLLERCLSGSLARWLGKLAPLIIVGFMLLMIPCGILAANIQPLSRAEERLPSSHPFQRILALSQDVFPSSVQNSNAKVHIVWGVKDMNMDKVSILRDGGIDAAVLEWDAGFQFDAAAQRHLWNVCEEVRTMEPSSLENFLSRDKDSPTNAGMVDCMLQDWKAFLEQPGNPGFPLSLAQVPTYMGRFLESTMIGQSGINQTMRQKWGNHFGYDPNDSSGKVKLVIVTVTSKLQSGPSFASDILKTHYNMFQDWIKVINSPIGRLSAPPSARNAFQTSEGSSNGPNWIWMHTQTIFRTSAILGASVGTALAFVVILMATQQIIIALSSFVTIACILVSVLAMMRIANYELGTITSICITILAGFAVDYVVHLAHAFNHSTETTRAEKFQETFDVMGVSVLSGMVSSVLAGVVLFTCSLQFFAKFGFFLLFTVILAWLWGNCFFMCIMKLIGPDSNTFWLFQVPSSILPSKCPAWTTPNQG